MKNIIKIILNRMINDRAFLIMPLIITPIVIFLAIYFSSSSISNPTIGIVNNSSFKAENVNIVELNEKVPLSDLVKNKYDAVVYFDDDTFTIDTIKGEDYRENVEKMVKGEEADFKTENKRGPGTNIIGYLSMFVLLLGGQLYKFFFDDKKLIAGRVISSGVSYEEYIMSHCIAVFTMIFVPTCSITIFLKELLNINTNMTALEFVLIIFLLCFLASSFGLFICTVADNDRTANMLGVMIIVSTTLVSGSFFTISNNKIIASMGSILPQRHLLNLAMNIENNNIISYGSLFNIIMASIIMLAVSFMVNKYRMKFRNCM